MGRGSMPLNATIWAKLTRPLLLSRRWKHRLFQHRCAIGRLRSFECASELTGNLTLKCLSKSSSVSLHWRINGFLQERPPKPARLAHELQAVFVRALEGGRSGRVW